MITNQGGIAFALFNLLRHGSAAPFPLPELFATRLLWLRHELRQRGFIVEGVYISVYHPQMQREYIEAAYYELCSLLGPTVFMTENSRKPAPLMLRAAGITVYHGDSPEDALAAEAAGVDFVPVMRFMG